MAPLRAGLLLSLLPAALATTPRSVTLTGLGTLQGQLNQYYSAVAEFLGVPYGTATRWQSATAATWSGTKTATSATGLKCPETPSSGATPATGTTEDCLHLNVWAPDAVLSAAPGTATLPVMVFFHGGGYTSGSPEDQASQGMIKAMGSKVISVSVGYRLGVFGFLNCDDAVNGNGGKGGNLGLQDQRLALQWVQTNIKFFGGDSTKVMIHGQSAGGNAVLAHLVMPASYSLYSSAIVQSGANNLITDTTYANTQYQSLLTKIGCPDFACLKTKSTSAIQVAASQVSGKFWPTVDGTSLTGNPADLIARGTYNKVPVIIGTVRDEWFYFMSHTVPDPTTYSSSSLDTDMTAAGGYSLITKTAFTSAQWAQCKTAYSVGATYPYDYPTSLGTSTQSWWTLQRMLTDRNSGHCSARYAAKNLVAGGSNVWMYMMIDGTVATSTPTQHTADLGFIFPTASLSAAQVTQSTAMLQYWVNMAQSGDPNTGAFTSGLVAWPKYTVAGDTLLQMQQGGFQTVTNFRKSACDFWDAGFLPYYFQPQYTGPSTTTAAATTATTAASGGGAATTAAASAGAATTVASGGGAATTVATGGGATTAAAGGGAATTVASGGGAATTVAGNVTTVRAAGTTFLKASSAASRQAGGVSLTLSLSCLALLALQQLAYRA